MSLLLFVVFVMLLCLFRDYVVDCGLGCLGALFESVCLFVCVGGLCVP